MKLTDLVTPDDILIDSFVRESTQLNETLLTEADIKSFIVSKAQKLKQVLSKANNPLEALNDAQGKIWAKVQSSGLTDAEKQKVVQFAKKNAKIIKPALLITVLGAAILGMDTANASELVQNLQSMSPDTIQDIVQPLTDTKDAVTGSGADAQVDKFADSFMKKMKQLYDGGKNPIYNLGQKMSFDQAIQYAEQKTNIDSVEFVKHIAQQRDIDMKDATNEFFKWLQQRDAKGRSVFKDI